MSSSLLGAVLAGGLSSRFGSDKALATLGGERLLDRAVAALSPHCSSIVVIGREDGRHKGIPDWPRPGMGPLGGLCGALRHAFATGHDAVLSCGVDSVGLPTDLLALLVPAPAFCATQPVIGLWPVHAVEILEAMLTAPGKHSVMRFAETIGARPVTLPTAPVNVNYPEDLASLQARDL